jgi:hypothetical protein
MAYTPQLRTCQPTLPDTNMPSMMSLQISASALVPSSSPASLCKILGIAPTLPQIAFLAIQQNLQTCYIMGKLSVQEPALILVPIT